MWRISRPVALVVSSRTDPDTVEVPCERDQITGKEAALGSR